MVEPPCAAGPRPASVSSRSSPAAARGTGATAWSPARPPCSRRSSASASVTRRSSTATHAGGRRGDAGVPGGLPVQRQHLGVCRGRVLLPLLPGARGRGRLRPRRRAGDPGAQHPQPRQRRRQRRLADDVRRRRPALHRDGLRRTHEEAAIAAARAAYIAGFATTSNLEAGRRYGVPRRAPPLTRSACCTTTSGRRSLRRSSPSARAPRSWSTTYDVTSAVNVAVELAAPRAGARAARLRRPAEPGPRGAGPARRPRGTRQPGSSSLPRPRRVRHRRLAAGPVDLYGVGTSLVTGFRRPDRGMVYIQAGRAHR